ncbi:melatonin receptor type 1C-like [Strongylocentrotus purpuratus]|uniref:G-protein coupled receptors family 1 profile domain-containing protein n=1 Tax=Strongylocentrotus purpuratus TaxID=7668 RepID=A0A7M7ND90_STRPU|nr:melatonin receptor type 1C-like [Strongylocentrotus purpuratus]
MSEVYHNQTDDVSYGGRIVISIYFLLVSVCGIIGNLIILIVLFKIPKMRTHTNIFIGSLAVSDISTCSVLPFLVAGILSKTGWPMPNWTCILTTIYRFVSQGSGTWNLVVIAINRVVLVTMSTRVYRKLYNPWTMTVNIAFVWLFPLALVVIPYLTGAIDIGFDSGPNICSDTDLDRNGNPTNLYQLIQGTAFSCIPLCLVFICYVRIYVFVRSHVRRQEKTNPSMISKMSLRTASQDPSSSTSDQKADSDTHTRTKKQKVCIP